MFVKIGEKTTRMNKKGFISEIQHALVL